ncbi:coiled-coil domain-containing protein 34-like [Corticium candelabrum]|uniref:coiled-coil domain-containing protein 34-like n=1 Tax=Corticium candelabrum TaxID=121492 RepID=UPI002E2611E1|nr:coiled-coil domain-containing protein 34-like [Corticium candelabrum]
MFDLSEKDSLASFSDLLSGDRSASSNSLKLLQLQHGRQECFDLQKKKQVNGSRINAEFSSETKLVLSPWEQWILNKAKEEHHRKQIEKRKKQELCRTTLLKQHDDREKEKRSDNVIQQWLEEKQKKHKEQERKERQLERMKRHEKEQKQALISSMSEQKFAEWVERKRKEDEKKHGEMLKQAAREEDALYQRRIESEQAYNDWLASKRRGRSPRQSSFHNPIPWHDCLPKQKQPKSRRLVNLPPSPPNLFKAERT